MPHGTPDDPAIAAAFLHRFLQDQDGGGVRELSAYQAEFPGHEDLIAREFAALTAESGAEPAASGGGKTIAHYELLGELGRGGQGVVHKARDLRLKRIVALKVIGPMPRSEHILARFRREAEVASRLDHPGICGILDSGTSDGLTYIAMRFVDGQSLASELAESSPPVSRDEVLRIVRLMESAARAVHEAHRAGIIHRDIKPGNIMVTPTGEPVLLDFGLARDESDDVAELTQTGDVFGTPAYMSPEQLRGEGARLDQRTDVYALGAVLFECLTGRLPFVEKSRESLYRAILELAAPNVQSLNRAVPQDLAVVVATALAKDRDGRYTTAADLADDLARVSRFEPITARPVSPWVRAWRWVQRNRTVASLAAGLIAVLAVSLIVVLSNNQELAAALEDARAGRLSKQQREIQALIERGYQRLFSADPTGADEIFDELLALDPGNKTAIAGRYWHDIFEPKKAMAVLDRHAVGLGDDPDILWMRGLVLDVAGDEAAAQKYFERAGDGATHLRLYLEGVRVTRSFMSTDADDMKRGMAFFRRAILQAPRPQFHYFHSLLMSASRAQDRDVMDEAAAALENHWPNSVATLEAVAQFYLPVDEPRAVRAMEKIMQIEPSAMACSGLAAAALNHGDREAAMRWYDRGIELDRDFAAIWFLRGQLWERQGELEKAAADYGVSFDAEPRFYPAPMALAGIHKQRGDLDEAIAVLERAAAAFPEQPGIAEMLAELRREQKRD